MTSDTNSDTCSGGTDPYATDATESIKVGGLNTVVRAIAAGARHTCVLTMAGGVKCWGNNHNGQLGDGSVNARATPLDVAGLTANSSAIAAAQQHSCALDVSGTLRCWGTIDVERSMKNLSRKKSDRLKSPPSRTRLSPFRPVASIRARWPWTESIAGAAIPMAN